MGVGRMISRRWRIFRQEVLILFYAVRQRETPFFPKLLIGLTLFYLISPIDAVPDFIPFFGYLDDLIIVPFLINVSFRLLPDNIREAGTLQARQQKRKITRMVVIAIIILLLVMAGIFMLGWKLAGYAFGD